jgi:hypothetical protein
MHPTTPLTPLGSAGSRQPLIKVGKGLLNDGGLPVTH